MVKVISLSDEAYRKLKAIKGNRSFSEMVIDIINDKDGGKKKSILDLAGAWSDDSEYWENFKKDVRKSRDVAKMREVRF